ncbi:hypothetical protein GCM10008090_21660 [Arenicella chitinivorans]|uniref:DUF1285 domain-containing protein n=1 Tax=Arenicella chitinivorans TaxID=1329800 RepID=A0A918RWP0_9GAMM|nr:DUF1285 domain-containing protein [Arenicella chitinivorans]GHA11556.1 hypothetical protein GCM10008090_21660 [Arenicella chitinivorans]
MNKLDELDHQLTESKLPPVHQWRPEKVGRIDIHIDAQGVWFHEGGVIARPRLVRLFASILWHEASQYFLVTPVEKLAIEVEDVPFVVQKVACDSDVWTAETNVGDVCRIGIEHPVALRQYQGVWIPYVRVRYDLWARLSRACYQHWVDVAVAKVGDAYKDGETLSLSSQGVVFPVAR